MNVFNRIVMVLAILLGLFLVLFAMLRSLDAINIVRANLDYLEQSLFDDQFYYGFLLVLGILEFVLLILFWLEIRRTKRKTVRIKTRGGGKTQLGVESVVQSLEYRIDELAGVRKVKPDIISRGRNIKVRIDLDTSPSVNIPVLTDQIMVLCHDIVEGQLGVKIHGKVEINVRHEPYPRGTMPPTGPLGEEPITSPPTAARRLPVSEPEPLAPVASGAPVAFGAPAPSSVPVEPASMDVGDSEPSPSTPDQVSEDESQEDSSSDW